MPQDRKRLKEVAAGSRGAARAWASSCAPPAPARTKAEIKRDYEYLMRLWETVRELTLQSTAPALVYEEGSLIKRSIRDLYNKDIDEIIVAGDDGYREAKDFMRMLMPSHAKVRAALPRHRRRSSRATASRRSSTAMLQPQVTLKSGGYIVINQTEALVAIDVNSGPLDHASTRSRTRRSRPTWRPPRRSPASCACAILPASSSSTSSTWRRTATTARSRSG